MEIPDNDWWDRWKDLSYGIIQMNRMTEESPEFLYGYLEFSVTKRWTQMKAMMKDATYKPREGTARDARAKVINEAYRINGPWEYGVWTEKKKKTTEPTVPIKRKIEELPQAKKTKLEELFIKQMEDREREGLWHTPRDWTTELVLHIGEPGTGKTKTAMQMYPGAYWKQDIDWENYRGEDVVIYDNYYSGIALGEMIKLADCSPYEVKTNRGNIQFRAKKVVIISTTLPWKWYSFSGDVRKQQLYRRVKQVWWHSKGYKPYEWTNWNFFIMWYTKTQTNKINPDVEELIVPDEEDMETLLVSFPLEQVMDQIEEEQKARDLEQQTTSTSTSNQPDVKKETIADEDVNLTVVEPTITSTTTTTPVRRYRRRVFKPVK